jgi:hypothetical protein
MDSESKTFCFPVVFFLFLFFFLSACSTPSWLSTKKNTAEKSRLKELSDKEVIVIDKEEYIKVHNPNASQGSSQAKYLYVPVREYLAKKEAYTPSIIRNEEPKGPPKNPGKTSVPEQVQVVTPQLQSSGVPGLKKKVVIAYFDDRTTDVDEEFGDWIAEKLIREEGRKSAPILFVDYHTVKEFLQKQGIALTELESPRILHLLNEVFGIHALVVGALTGPYVFTTKTPSEKEETASAILKIEIRLLDTATGSVVKKLSANNPIFATTQKGTFSEEKAKVKAIDLTVADLGKSLSKEIDGLDWYCRIVKVEGEDVYLNAGKLSGLKPGDVMEFFRAGEKSETGPAKGRVQISNFFGIDASIGKVVKGTRPDVDDIVKRTQSKGT